jgi:shikimate kinase
VRAWRTENGMTRKTLSKASGVSSATSRSSRPAKATSRSCCCAKWRTPWACRSRSLVREDAADRKPIALLGLRGAGKSTLGAKLAEAMKLPFVELDREVEKEAGAELGEVFAMYGQDAFRRFERRALERVLKQNQQSVIATGGSLVTDPGTYKLLLERCTCVWLKASPEEHMARVIAQGDMRPFKGRSAALDEIRQLLADRDRLYARARRHHRHLRQDAQAEPHRTEERPRMISFETSPEQYHHWKLSFDGPVATLTLDIAEDKPLVPGYKLKLNSYDLGVDIELADALNRIRFEHPEVKSVVITSGKSRMFCSGANIYMLGHSSHAWKVNFCKYTNETRNSIEEASATSGLKFIAALNGTTAGGGYELALACDEIAMIDDRSSTVSLPEVPLLGVLPGTGGLTRLVDKEKSGAIWPTCSAPPPKACAPTAPSSGAWSTTWRSRSSSPKW